MTEIDRRNALRGILWGVAIVAGGAAVMPNGADAMEFVNGGDEFSAERKSLHEGASRRPAVPPPPSLGLLVA